MVRDNDQPAKVALFIDWDNLAISTAADMGGALPDVPALVTAAQRFGEVVVARAYSEWQLTSERLAIYRSGIEPVYAPTFRFESDSQPGGSKGKSLADPCMVADCVDFLHLMPDLRVYVLISGDKDLVPVVRLTQLRGKRVVVIGPDLVAAILKDMADEYIPYRSLVDPSTLQAPAPAPAPTATRRRRADSGRQAAGVDSPERGRQTRNHPPSPATSARTPAPIVPIDRARTSAVVEQEAAASVEATAAPAEESFSGQAAPPVEQLSEEVKPVIGKMLEILAEKEAAGRSRVRSTNLRDLMHGRQKGFHEKDVGFRRFKDLLDLAEQHRFIELKREGPVLWVVARKEEGEISRPTVTTAVPVSAIDSSADAPPAQPKLTPESVDGQLMDVVRFVSELRNRSRWLTYTYVLTNLTNHLTQSLPASSVDGEARGALNRLVQDGAITIDREPRELQVGSSRHRVRMCHLNDEHPLVEAAIKDSKQELPPPTSNGEPAAPTDESEPDAGEEKAVTSPEPAPQAAIEEPVAAEEPTEEEAELDPFAEAAAIVRDAVTDTKPFVGAALVKNRLTKRIAGFDEKTRGFKQFKQFLFEVERRGLIKVKSIGAATRVFPIDETDGATEQGAEVGATTEAPAGQLESAE